MGQSEWRVLGPNREKVTEKWKQLRIEELRDLLGSLDIIRAIKTRMRWAEHVECMRRVGNVYTACK
jgi:uncharacterized protein with WD repeat